MARNVEIKARIESIESIFPRASALAEDGPVVIVQDDTFFACPNGRLKLRVFSPEEGQLIFYRRPDKQGPKESFYLISAVNSPDILRESLSLAYGQTGRVRKVRTLFLVGRTRIHLDRVESLGDFLELEVVLTDGESAQAGEAVAKDLMGRLGILPNQLIEGAYVDLLQAKSAEQAVPLDRLAPDGLCAGPSDPGYGETIKAIEQQIREMVDRETRAWDTQDAEALVSIFHPDTVWPWPATPQAHDPVGWVFPLGRFERQRWKQDWQELFRTCELIHNRRSTIKIVVSAQGDGAFAVVDVDTLWRHKETGEDFHWRGRACKGYTRIGPEWKLIYHTGLLDYENAGTVPMKPVEDR